VLAQFGVERVPLTLRPAQRGRPRVLHAHDGFGGPGRPLRERVVDERAEQPAGGERLGVASARRPGARNAGPGGPHGVQRRAQRIVVALVVLQEREPAAGAQEPRALGEPDLGVDPVERRAGDDQVERRVWRFEVLEGGDLEGDAGTVA
jgi:hypothetical protein